MSEMYWNKSVVPVKLFPDWSYQTYSRRGISEDLKTLLSCQRHMYMYFAYAVSYRSQWHFIPMEYSKKKPN